MLKRPVVLPVKCYTLEELEASKYNEDVEGTSQRDFDFYNIDVVAPHIEDANKSIVEVAGSSYTVFLPKEEVTKRIQ